MFRSRNAFFSGPADDVALKGEADGEGGLARGGMEAGNGKFDAGVEGQGEATAEWEMSSGDSRRKVDLFLAVVWAPIVEVGIDFDFGPEPSKAAILQRIVQNEASAKERGLRAGQIAAERPLKHERADSLPACDSRGDYSVWRTVPVRTSWKTCREERRQFVIAPVSFRGEHADFGYYRKITEAVG